jgi:hypothetical protein
MELAREFDCLAAVVRFTNDFVTLRFEQAAKAVAKERVVVGDEDTHG